MTDPEKPRWPVACATGHRRLPAAQLHWVDEQIERVVAKLKQEHGMLTGVSGMALCIDQRWAERVKLAGLRLHAMIPFPHQAARWPAAARDHWRALLDTADQVTCVSKENPDSPRAAAAMLHQRNDAMLSVSQVVVAVWDPGKFRGGTYSAIKKAVRQGKPIIWLNPEAQTVTMPRDRRWAELTGAPALTRESR